MNVLPPAKRATVLASLCEGVGIRATARITETNRETVARLALEVGEACQRLHDDRLVQLRPVRVELDEAWSFVYAKQANSKDPEQGDQYAYVALDADTRAILAYHVGKRTAANTGGFLLDLASRCLTTPQVTADGFRQYAPAVARAFGKDADFAMCIKEYVASCEVEAKRRYSPAKAVSMERIRVSGEPDDATISTAYVERQNLTIRMLSRRFTRLTNAFSKSLRHHRAAFALHAAYYNFCWTHATLSAAAKCPTTPAMAAGVAAAPWRVADLLAECAGYPRREPTRIGNPLHADVISERAYGRRSFW